MNTSSVRHRGNKAPGLQVTGFPFRGLTKQEFHLRLSVIGLPKRFWGLYDLWISDCKNSGIEEAITRAKARKVAFLSAYSESTIPKFRGRNLDLLSSLFNWGIQPRNFPLAVQVFNLYTSVTFLEATPNQLAKFQDAVNSRPVHIPSSLEEGIVRAVESHGLTVEVSKIVPLVLYQGSPEKRAPLPLSRESVPHSAPIDLDLRLFNTDGGRDLIHQFREFYIPLLKGYSSFPSFHNGRMTGQPLLSGKIALIQEPGGKLRSVASPYRIHQWVLRPLGQALYSTLSKLPWDCTFDHSIAIPTIQSALRRGVRCHSVDLSSATDTFPLSLQMVCIKALLPQKHINHLFLWEKISRGMWQYGDTYLRWTKGQPLGLFPSFAAFALTHGFLLQSLQPWKGQFFVLGDDVIILDDKLYYAYIRALDALKVPWSPSKTISSRRLSEFAGKVICSDKVIPQLKWRRVSDDNFLDLAVLLGRRSRQLMSPLQKRVLDKVSDLLPPWGLNWSRPGSNFQDAYLRTLNFERKYMSSFMLGSNLGLRRLLTQRVHETNYEIDSNFLESLSTTFDEKVDYLLSSHPFHPLLGFGMDLDDIPEQLGIASQFPTKSVPSARRDTLTRYLGYLRRDKGR